MNPKRTEPFIVALQSLRLQLRQGAFDFDRRLAATEIADQLQLSATPVREALARLAGEGLVEDRRGQGYFVRRPSGLDIADLYRMSLAHLTIAFESRSLPIPAEGGEATSSDGPEEAAGPVARVERLFDDWMREAGGWALLDAHRRVQGRLGPVRRREPLLIPDLAAEAQALLEVDAAGEAAPRAAAVRAFHRRRIRLAHRLAGLMERRPGPPL